MYRLKSGSILPGKGIGPFRLGMTFNEVTGQVSQYKQRELANASQIICENVKIWIDHQTDLVSQILVYGSFDGTFDGWLSVGKTLADALEKGYSYHEELGAYMLDGIEGLCMELEDDCDLDDDAPWDERTAPITRISVYPVDESALFSSGRSEI